MRIAGGFDHSQIYNDISTLRLRDSLSGIGEQTAPKEENAVSAAPVKENAEQAENSAKRERLLGLEDISLTFNKDDDFSLIGKTSDITGLDVEKAVSFSKKDDILGQYRSSEASVPVYSGEDGTVIAK
ncbi:MAG: hypothetical protein K5871_00055 [Lachnospiraceae bacterium]|nr:hypothetical protein [Lachnospiraceae bacterium]